MDDSGKCLAQEEQALPVPVVVAVDEPLEAEQAEMPDDMIEQVQEWENVEY